MADIDALLPTYLSPAIHFPEGSCYKAIKSLASYKTCHDGTPTEARIVLSCHEESQGVSNGTHEVEHILKIKIQTPGNSPDSSHLPQAEPSTTTAAEISALRLFRDHKVPHVPHLRAWKLESQDSNGPLPGGYITYVIMTKMPGRTLFDMIYWTLPTAEREEIVTSFLKTLRSLYAIGVEPLDCGLRNVMWDQASRSCSIIDLEMWRETSTRDIAASDELKVLRRWGLAQSPPARDWWSAWNAQS